MVVVFDVDGTMFDTKREIIYAMNKVLKRQGIKEINAEEANQFIGLPFHDTLPVYRQISCGESDFITDEFRKEYQKIILESEPYTGLVDTLMILKNQGIKLCVATNKPSYQIKALFNHYNISMYFEIIKTKDGSNKTKGQMLEEIRNGLPDEWYYMVGDTVFDLEAAKKAGYKYIEALYGYGKFENVNELQISHIMDIVKVLDHENV